MTTKRPQDFSLSERFQLSLDSQGKEGEALNAWCRYPAENWQHIRTTNPIESVFATVRLRTTKTKNCGSRITTLAMAFKLTRIFHDRSGQVC